jgi:phosphate uptake regulator
MLFFDYLRGDRPPLIRQALKDMQIMLDTSLQMFEDATAALLENEILEADLEAQDQTVNRKETEIRRAVLQHFANDPRREMLFGLVLISIVQDAERIGDLAKSIAETARLAKAPRHGVHVDTLRRIRDRLVQTFRDTRKSFADADERGAREVMGVSVAIKEELTDLGRALANDEALSTNSAVVLAVATRMFSRTSSHLSNIASSVAMPFDQIRRPPGWE